MRKQELIHLHSLFAEVKSYCLREDDLSISLSEYESLKTDTLMLHRHKEEHKEAVFALTEAITDSFRDEQPELASANTD